MSLFVHENVRDKFIDHHQHQYCPRHYFKDHYYQLSSLLYLYHHLWTDNLNLTSIFLHNKHVQTMSLCRYLFSVCLVELEVEQLCVDI